MKIEDIGDEKILVNLSPDDLRELDITYDEMDYGNIETRRVIWTILDEAGKRLGKHLQTDGKLLIEAAPDENGGCVMMFTVTDTVLKNGRNLVMKKEKGVFLWQTEDENNFLDVFSFLQKNREKINSVTWYRYRNSFYAVAEVNTKYMPFFEITLSEYGNTETENKALISSVTEYGTMLLSC